MVRVFVFTYLGLQYRSPGIYRSFLSSPQPSHILWTQEFRFVPSFLKSLSLSKPTSSYFSHPVHNAPCLPSHVRVHSFLISAGQLLTPSDLCCPIKYHSDLSILIHNWGFRRADVTPPKLNVIFSKFRWIWNPPKYIFLLPFPVVYTV